jgi:hypothetical protein
MIDETHLTTEVTNIETELLPIVNTAKNLSIVDQETMEIGIDFLGKVKAMHDKVEQTRKFFVKPLLDIKRTYDEKFSPALDQLESAEKIIKKTMTDYRLTLRESAPAAKTIATDDAKVTFVKLRRFRVLDTSLIPKEYWCVDLKKIEKVVDSGMNNIPGIEVYDEEQVRSSYAG